MQRLIPGKTKVRIELFRGVTLADIVIGVVAMAMLVLVLLSTLPGKVWFCLGIAAVAVLLVVRLDEQPNYIFLLHILAYFGYHRHYGRKRRDTDILGKSEDQAEEDEYRPLTAKELKQEDKLLKNSSTPDEVKESIRARRAEQSRIAAARLAREKERKKKAPQYGRAYRVHRHKRGVYRVSQ